MTERVMIDLETLGTEPGATIISIGAVRFSPSGVWEDMTFYRSVSPQSCQDAGLTIDADTLEWWLGQDDEVQDVLTGGDPLLAVLSDFTAFYADADEIWAFSPSFDCSILAAAYDAVGEDTPWGFRDERDARTLAALPTGTDVERRGDLHNALDDARHQAREASAVLRAIWEGTQ